MWYYEALLRRTLNTSIPVPVDDKNPEFSDLRYRVSMMNDKTFRIKVTPVQLPTEDNGLTEPTDYDRWEVPDSLLGNTQEDYGMRLTWGGFQGASMGGDPGITTNFLSTQKRNLVMSEYYIEMGFLVDSTHIYGFGERQGTFELKPGNYSSWNNGRDNHYDSGRLGGNSYGDHPFVLAKLNDNTFCGIFFKNSNAKVLEITRTGKNKSILNFRAIGGVLDFFTFYAEQAEDVLVAYHSVIGNANLPPFWALGFHQSAWRYNNTAALNEVLEGYSQAEMPLEGIWLDIEYMDRYRNFMLNTTRFNKFATTAAAIHANGQKLVTIVDAGFGVADDYLWYNQADKLGICIKSNKTGGNLIGNVWPGKSAFVDFSNPKSTDFMVSGLSALYDATNTDGICPTGTEEPIEKMTISLSGQYFSDTEANRDKNIEFNMHSLYGLYQSKATYQLWVKGTKLQGRRPFILSRSTFAGSGQYAAHWLGDNWSQWEYMQFSVAGIMNFNMFGIPLVGADVCGFHSNFTQDMCARWTQLAVFYPFARNHYNLTTNNGADPIAHQELYLLEGDYKISAKNSLYQRLSFIRYMYTRLFEVSKNIVGTLVKPLFFAFPEDSGTLQGTEHSFMVGDALKVTPVLTKADSDSQIVNSYFPKNTRFISLNDFKTIISGVGANETLKASWNYTLVHQKEGTLIPWQHAEGMTLPRTKNMIADKGINLIVFPDTNKHAKGTLYIDQNGDDRNDYNLGFYQYYDITYNNKRVAFNLLDGSGAKGSQNTGNQVLVSIMVLGMTNVTSSDNLRGCAFNNTMFPRPVNVTYDSDSAMITIMANQGDQLLFNNLQSIQFTTDANDASFCTPKYVIGGITNVYRDDRNDVIVKKVVNIKSQSNSTDLPDLTAEFTLLQDNLLNVKIYDPTDANAFKAPKESFNLNPNFNPPTIDITGILTLPNENEDFFYEVHNHLDPNTVLYSTKNLPFLYSKYYKKTTATVNSNGNLFGLGERVGDFFLSEGVYTLWARDIPSPVEDGKRPGKNVYGVHPVLFSKLKTGTDFFAVFDHNAGAQDYIIKKNGNDWQVTQIKTSGVTDQYIMVNDQLPQVVKSFINLVGKPLMVPEWSLGWHQCRYGYNSTDMVNQIVTNYLGNNIPLDVMWTDIDYMDMYKDFTVSRTEFAGLADNVTSWRKNYNIRYIPIMDAAVAYDESSNTPYSRGKSKGVFIKDPNNSGKPFIGKVWPGPAVYLDWLKNGAEDYWVDELNRLHKVLPFDGLWIDMNEASNFCNGYCTKDQIVTDTIQNKLFYTPGARQLNDKSISIDATHDGGATEYEAHSLYGFYMSKATNNFFNNTLKTRPFIITRSSYSGVGKYASHWLGDNFATYDMLKYSIGGIYSFNMYGVPVTGADICGFIFDTNANLCARWYAIGAFYPFARNHNNKVEIPQEPYVAMFQVQIPGSTYTYTDFFRQMYWKRYALHRYQYSYLHRASTNGEAYFKPLFYNYPDESSAYKRVEYNVLLGDSIKLSPALEESQVTSFYFPDKSATWCPLWPGKFNKCFSGASEQKQLLNFDEVWVHIKSGSIIPMQLGDLKTVPENLNIESLKNQTLDLAVLCDSKYKASGFIRFDDGETQDLNLYSEFYFNATGSSPFIGAGNLYMNVVQVQDASLDKVSNFQKIGSVVVYSASQFKLGKSAQMTIDRNTGPSVQASATYDSTNNIARFVLKEGTEVDLRDVKQIHISSK